ncbi:MAG: hypothetical protein ACOYXC_22255 [Candidatus Rifleibacteriota bacterium]
MKGSYVLVTVLFGLFILWLYTAGTIWNNSKKRRENEPGENNCVLAGMKIFLVLFIPLFAWMLIPNFRGIPKPKKVCQANQRVIAGAIAEYYKSVGTSPDPINLRNGKINIKPLLEKKCLRAPIRSYRDCIYVGFPCSNGDVEVFCLSCGFPDQQEKSIKEEFNRRFALASSPATDLSIDFNATTDYSQQYESETLERVRPYYGIPLMETFFDPMEEK